MRRGKAERSGTKMAGYAAIDEEKRRLREEGGIFCCEDAMKQDGLVDENERRD